jgi:hypothetical protein
MHLAPCGHARVAGSVRLRDPLVARQATLWVHSRGHCGRPVLVQGLVARETMPWLQEVSQPYGTEITIADDVGIIRL